MRRYYALAISERYAAYTYVTQDFKNGFKNMLRVWFFLQAINSLYVKRNGETGGMKRRTRRRLGCNKLAVYYLLTKTIFGRPFTIMRSVFFVT
jgi:hypothetical protein